MGIFDRIKEWAVGPGGWLADSNKDEEYSRVDIELDELEHQRWEREPDDEWINRLRNSHRDGEDHPA